MTSKPRQKLVDKALILRKADIVKTILFRKAGQPSKPNTPCFVYYFPCGENSKVSSSLVSFEKRCRWGTPSYNFLSCLVCGDEEQISLTYRVSIAEKSAQDGVQSIGTFFESKLYSTAREKAMYCYLDVIVSLSLKVTSDQNDKFR